MLKINKTTLFLFLLGLVLCVPIVLPYMQPGYFPTHDGEWAVVRAGEMFREIRDLQFPPRYSASLNFGYGYPLFNFTYPFPYYLSTGLHVFQFGFVDSIKVIFALSVFGSFTSMFFLSRHFWKNSFAGFLSGVLYVFLPYHLVDLFVRGSIGESIAFVLYPLLLLFFLFVLQKKHITLSVFFIAVLTAVLITTHNISAVYFGIIFAFYFLALFLSGKKTELLYTMGAFGWGVLIASFFFLPALFEKKHIKLSIIPIADRNLYYLTVQKLLGSPWGYGTPTDKNPFTYQIGIPQMIGFILACFALIKIKSVEKTIVSLFLVLTLAFVLMTFSFSFPIWKLPLLSEINYPWTLLLPIGFLISFLSGAVVNLKWGRGIVVVLSIVAIALYLPFAKPESTSNKGDSYYLTNPATTTSSNELMPLWVESQPTVLFSKKVTSKNPVENLVYTSDMISFTINSNKGETISINQIYYPGWVGLLNNENVSISHDNKYGIMTIKVPEGKSSVVLIFSETPLRLFADILSAVSLFGLVLFLVIAIWRKKHGKKKK